MTQEQVDQEKTAALNARLAASGLAPQSVDNFYAWKSRGGPPVQPRTFLEVLSRSPFEEWSTEDVRALFIVKILILILSLYF